MSEQPPDSLIPYDEIVQEALRAVVGRVLGEVEATGLPGEHHFYITFKTGAAGVDIPKHLSEKFPDEMTIVIQNRFWDLKVSDDGLRGRPQLQPGAVQALHSLRRDHRLRRSGGQFRAAIPGAGRGIGAGGLRAGPERSAGRRADRGWLQRRFRRFQSEEVTAPAGRHPELVSGSILSRGAAEAWMLKQVQHDEE